LSDLEPIPSLVPTLAIEVLSESNTRREMELKRGEYFRAGVRVVWIVDPDARAVEVYTSVNTPERVLKGEELMDGGDVLPGFTLSVNALFAQLVPPRPPTAGQGE
jgi:Uma2 family endonuclease